MRNMVIFTDVGGDSDDTLMLLMARAAHLRGDCNVMGIICSGTHDNAASAAYANWLVNPEWVDVPVVSGSDHLRLPEIFPMPSYCYAGGPQYPMFRRRMQEVDGEVTFLLCSPLGDVIDQVQLLGLRALSQPIKLVVMGNLKEDGTPDFDQAFNLRANKEATERVFNQFGETFVLDLVIDRDECYQYPLTADFYFARSDHRLWVHHRRLAERNLRIIEKKLPEVWERTYKGNETMAIPYDAVAFWKAVYPGEDADNFWFRLDLAVRDHPRAF